MINTSIFSKGVIFKISIIFPFLTSIDIIESEILNLKLENVILVEKTRLELIRE